MDSSPLRFNPPLSGKGQRTLQKKMKYQFL